MNLEKAIVVDGVIVNVIVVSPEAKTHGGSPLVDIPEGAGIGWTYDGETFSPPE